MEWFLAYETGRQADRQADKQYYPIRGMLRTPLTFATHRYDPNITCISGRALTMLCSPLYIVKSKH
eukprot:501538-Pelagomonas_calceolata.AAC.2